MSGRVLTDLPAASSSRPGRRNARAATPEAPAPGDLVLLAAPDAAGGRPWGAGLVPLARAAGAVVILLPDDPGASAWIVAAARRWRRDGDGTVVRDLEAVVSLAGRVPVRAGGIRPPRSAVVRRWARRAWTPCPWCPGGGVAGGLCARCRAPLGQEAA